MAGIVSGMGSVLVAYATRSGAARDIAATVAQVLGEAGNDVRLANLREIPQVAGADLVVVGSGIQATAWYPEASSWLSANAAALRATRVAVFNTCLSAADPARQGEALGYNQSAAQTVAADASQSFAGRADKQQLGFLQRLLLRVMRQPDQDHVDAGRARDWAKKLLPASQI